MIGPDSLSICRQGGFDSYLRCPRRVAWVDIRGQSTLRWISLHQNQRFCCRRVGWDHLNVLTQWCLVRGGPPNSLQSISSLALCHLCNWNSAFGDWRARSVPITINMCGPPECVSALIQGRHENKLVGTCVRPLGLQDLRSKGCMERTSMSIEVLHPQINCVSWLPVLK